MTHATKYLNTSIRKETIAFKHSLRFSGSAPTFYALEHSVAAVLRKTMKEKKWEKCGAFGENFKMFFL